MRARRHLLAIVTWGTLLAACSGQFPSGSGGPPGASTGPIGAGTSNPSTSPPPGIGGPGPSTPVAPPPGGSGTIVGTIAFQMTFERIDDVTQEKKKESLGITVDVRLLQDSSFGADGYYVDDGSTYTVNVHSTTERQLGDCLATSETTANAQHAFTDQPTSYENYIEATVDRAAKTVLFDAGLSWIYEVTGNDCDGRDPYTGENTIGLTCPFFGLTARLIEGAATDTIDAACQLPGGETYSGILTLTR